MIHYFIGNLGHILLIGSFILSLAAAYGYFRSTRFPDESEDWKSWKNFGRYLFIVHGILAIGAVTTLFIIINRGYFEYHYAYSHSSSILPVYYQISAFWEGQEGSFLLWIFWNVLLGFVLIKTNKFWEAPVMVVFALVQAFLLSMILGVVIGNLKVGSSPFMLLRDVMDAPIFKMDPDFIPEDGSGLNPLLQNYWMVIHPPTLFLGFATTLIPFAYCFAGLWIGKFKEWIRPALPWALFSGAVLGVGILMGAYWAYETLNFGGYWNWDPVENAVYVPWLVLIAAIHTMIAYKNSTSALKAAMILSMSAFLLIVYSTFLTRSGILGDSSVHSFTDLGLSGQLLIYLLAFLGGTILICILKWKKIGSDEKEVSTYSREFWIFMGATVLCLMGFQVIIPTSIPVWNSIMNNLGIESNLAPSPDQIQFYTKWQIWGGILVAILSGTGQFFWWSKMDKDKLKNVVKGPIVISVVLTGIIIIISSKQFLNPFYEEVEAGETSKVVSALTGYFLLLLTGIYSIVANTTILIDRWKTNINLSGGAIVHIGVALMLLGILLSSGYSKIVSLNFTGQVWAQDEHLNTKNLRLILNEPVRMGEYSLLFTGSRKKVKGLKGYVDENDLIIINKTQAIARVNETGSFQKGDTLDLIDPESSYFEVQYTKNDKTFTLFPRIQKNEQMGIVVSPDINHRLTFDLYTHITAYSGQIEEKEWSETQEELVQLKKPFFVNDYVATLEKVERIAKVEGVELTENDVAVKAFITVQGERKDYTAEPIYIIKNMSAGMIPYTIGDLGVKLSILEIDPKNDAFKIGINTTQKDWIIMEAVEKPYINLLWLGTLILVIGFGIAIRRRYLEFYKMQSKGIE